MINIIPEVILKIFSGIFFMISLPKNIAIKLLKIIAKIEPKIRLNLNSG